MASIGSQGLPPLTGELGKAFQAEGPATVQAGTLAGPMESDLDFDLNIHDQISITRDALFIGNRPLPPLPQKMTPSQAARLAEILDFLHRGITCATENIQAKEDGTQVTLGFADWQKVMVIQMLLARYLRAVAEPDSLND